MEQTVKRRSSIKIMASMIGLVKPLAHIMAAAVILGTLGYLCAIFLTITAGYALKAVLDGQAVTGFFKILVILAVARGILHYAEQYCCLLYTSDAADEEDSVELGGRSSIKKKKRRRLQE